MQIYTVIFNKSNREKIHKIPPFVSSETKLTNPFNTKHKRTIRSQYIYVLQPPKRLNRFA